MILYSGSLTVSPKIKKVQLNFYIFIFLTLKVFLIERSIFDFMGFMFGMIIADLLYLTFLIIGLFGVYQYRVNYVAAVSLFCFVFMGYFSSTRPTSTDKEPVYTGLK